MRRTWPLSIALGVIVLASGCAVEPYYLGPPGADGGPAADTGPTADTGPIDAPFPDAPGPDIGPVDATGLRVDGGDVGSCQAELCNGLDDDCDGEVDDGYDFLVDPRHCGGCSPCVLEHAIPACSAGRCTVLACESGFSDGNGDPADGCELACVAVGPEICDGIDDDCDGLVDAADPELVSPPNTCVQFGQCMGSAPTCAGRSGWICDYGVGVETSGAGRLVLEETLCDGLDGDCDGLADDPFGLLGTDCSDGGVGVCGAVGRYACTPDMRDVACVITSMPRPAGGELCNGLDDDCDGLTDERADGPVFGGVTDDMVAVTVAGRTVYVYRYEASRADSTATSPGSLEARACSATARLPWAGATHVQAAAACAAAGFRLCTQAEWGAACGASAFPYGDVYGADACNGLDHDTDPGMTGDQDAALPAGALAMCATPLGVRDLSGNLKEWTADLLGTTGTPPRPVYGVRGGAYDSPRDGLRCDFTFASAPEDFSYANLGFRCCSDTAP